MKLKKILARKGYKAIKMKRLKTNHFMVKVTINNKTGRFILDTGASNSCIDVHDASKFDLLTNSSNTLAAGAGATNMKTHESVNNSISLGKWQFHNFHLVLFDLSHVKSALLQHGEPDIDGIIGADILLKGKAIIDYKKNRLYLKKMVYKY
ncbi:MAG TPA: acid protease [Flavobacteriia bacterium]|nr:acid protease [Flavobacteriia bacterium]